MLLKLFRQKHLIYFIQKNNRTKKGENYNKQKENNTINNNAFIHIAGRI